MLEVADTEFVVEGGDGVAHAVESMKPGRPLHNLSGILRIIFGVETRSC